MLHPTNEETENVALDFGEEEELSRRRFVRHPVAVCFHLLFRVSAIIAYLLCTWFSSSFIVNFVVIVLLLSMDFWTVKNITGRLLVGLRWWNYVDEDGKSHWVYESKKGAAKNLITNTETRIFWVSLVVCQIFWVIFFFGTLIFLHFEWFMVVCVGNILNGANLYGYVRCKMGSKKKMSSMASNFFGQQMFSSMLSNLTSSKKSETNQS